MNRVVKRTFRDAMAHTPIFIHQILTKKKIKSMTAHIMSREDRLKCENDIEVRKDIVEKYKAANPKSAKRLEKKISSLFTNNPRFKDEKKELLDSLKQQIEFAWFAYGFHPDEFVFFDLAGVNKDLTKFKTFVSETERLVFRFSANDFTQSLFSDKADTYKRLKEFYKRDACIIDHKSSEHDLEVFIKKHPVFVEKLVNSSRGDGVKLVKNVKDIHSYYQRLRKLGKVLLEECVTQSKELAAFNQSSVNTVRVSTYYTRNGIIPVHGFFRSGREGSFIDNAAAGGVFATVDVERGVICSEGCDEYGYRYPKHPDTGTIFKGTVFPEWDKALEICRSASLRFPKVKYISYDLAYSEKSGWMIIEINPSGQYIHQAGTLEGFRNKFYDLIDNMDLLVPYSMERI